MPTHSPLQKKLIFSFRPQKNGDFFSNSVHRYLKDERVPTHGPLKNAPQNPSENLVNTGVLILNGMAVERLCEMHIFSFR